MGTNYYVTRDTCPMCNHAETRLHIGKSSAGWKFCFHAINELNLKSYRQWMDYISECGALFDEYGREFTLDQFLKLVDSKQCDKDNTTEESWRSEDSFPYNDPDGYNFLAREFS